jgi:hypothetical protein
MLQTRQMRVSARELTRRLLPLLSVLLVFDAAVFSISIHFTFGMSVSDHHSNVC